MEDLSSQVPSEDVVGKYKRLLAMARSSLEANQTTLAEKDKQISALKSALETEKLQNNTLQRKNHLGFGKFDEEQNPASILRRVDVKDVIWILIEYESGDAWICFRSEQELDDFVQRGTGEPLVKPAKCLTPQEAGLLETECKKRVDRIVEEFRRFKVRSEIARKQKDAESRRSNGSRALVSQSSDEYYDNSDSVPASTASRDDIQKLQQQMVDNENKWKTSYEQLARENEVLRNKDTDQLLLVQLRERYEECKAERDELSDKLKVYTSINGSNNASNGMGRKSLEQLYIDLKGEYKDFRRRALALERDRLRHIEELREELESLRIDSDQLASEAGPGTGSGTSTKLTVENSKLLHLRHLVLQYLSCKECDVREHMERALMTLLRFTGPEKQAVLDRKKEDNRSKEPTIFSFMSGYLV